MRNIIFIQLSLIAFMSGCMAFNERLHAVQSLVEAIDQKLDINYVFFQQHKQQKSNPLVCDAKLGPQCKIINDKSLLDYTSHQKDTEAIKNKKKVVVQNWEANVEQEKNGDKNLFYVITNKLRDQILDPATTDSLQETFALLNFEELNLQRTDVKILDMSSVVMNTKTNEGRVYYGFRSKAPNEATIMTVSYINMLQPSQNQFASQKEIIDYEKYIAQNKDVPSKYWPPAKTYISTPLRETGKVVFNRLVNVQHLYVRKNSLQEYFKTLRTKGSNGAIEYNVIGFKNGVKVVYFQSKTFSSINSWVKLTPNKQNVLIDMLEIEANTDVDNIYTTYAYKQSLKLQKSVKETLGVYVQTKLKERKYENMNDAQITSDIKYDLQKKLKDYAFDDQQISKLLEKFYFKRRDQRTGEMMLPDGYEVLVTIGKKELSKADKLQKKEQLIEQVMLNGVTRKEAEEIVKQISDHNLDELDLDNVQFKVIPAGGGDDVNIDDLANQFAQ